jgi:hypothetical protein
VIGGFGGRPWLDGRVRLAHTAIGYSVKWIDSTADTYANGAKAALTAFTALIADARAGRQIKGWSCPDSHRRQSLPHKSRRKFGISERGPLNPDLLRPCPRVSTRCHPKSANGRRAHDQRSSFKDALRIFGTGMRTRRRALTVSGSNAISRYLRLERDQRLRSGLTLFAYRHTVEAKVTRFLIRRIRLALVPCCPR